MDALGRELRLELLVVDLLEEVLEAAVIDIEDRVLGREVDRPAAVEAVVPAGPRKADDGVIQVVHAHRDARALELEPLPVDRVAASQIGRPSVRYGWCQY